MCLYQILWLSGFYVLSSKFICLYSFMAFTKTLFANKMTTMIHFFSVLLAIPEQDSHHSSAHLTLAPNILLPVFFIWLPRLNDIVINSTDYRLRLVKFRSWHWYFNCCLTYGKLLHHYDWCSLGILCLVASAVSRLCYPMDCSLPSSSVHGILRQEYWSGLPCPSSNNTRVSRLTNLFTCLELTMKIS